MSEEEELTNGLDEHPEETYETARVNVGVKVTEVAGRPLETDEERELFINLLNIFFASEPVHENLKAFVQFYMNQLVVPEETKLIVPEKKLILP